MFHEVLKKKAKHKYKSDTSSNIKEKNEKFAMQSKLQKNKQFQLAGFSHAVRLVAKFPKVLVHSK